MTAAAPPGLPTGLSGSKIQSLSQHPAAGYAGAAIAVAAWGGGSVLAKVIDLPGVTIAIYRFGLHGLAMLAFLSLRRRSMSWRAMKASALGGIALGLDVALFFSAIQQTSVVNATVIGALQPVVILLVAGPLFGERIRAMEVGLSAVAVAAAIVVVGSGAASSDASRQGDLLALGAVFSWAAYFVFSKRSKGVITSNEYTTGTAVWTALINLPIALAFGLELGPPSAIDWFWLVVMAFTAGLMGHALMNWSLVLIPLWVGSVLTLLIPVASSLLAWAVLGETVTPIQMAAVAVVLAALAVIVRGQARANSRRSPKQPGGPSSIGPAGRRGYRPDGVKVR